MATIINGHHCSISRAAALMEKTYQCMDSDGTDHCYQINGHSLASSMATIISVCGCFIRTAVNSLLQCHVIQLTDMVFPSQYRFTTMV